MSMNRNQTIAILLVVLGVLMASTAQLTEIIGPGPAKYVVSIAGLLNSILAGVLGVFTSQTGMVKDVANMKEVKQVVLDPAQPATKALDNATPNNVVVK